MGLKENLQSTLKSAMKSGNVEETEVVRLLIAAIKNRELEKRAKMGEETLTEEEAMKVLQSEAKKRREAITLFRNGNREDLAKKEEAELAFIGRYLPKLMSKEETESAVRAYLLGAKPADFPSAIKGVMQELKGKVDTAYAAECVKKYFGTTTR